MLPDEQCRLLASGVDYVTFRLVLLVEEMCRAGVIEKGFGIGGPYGYGGNFQNDVFTMRSHDENLDVDCTCGAALLGTRCTLTCPWNPPQFKCGDFEVRWHKYIGRSQQVHDQSLESLGAMFDRCERSLKP